MDATNFKTITPYGNLRVTVGLNRVAIEVTVQGVADREVFEANLPMCGVWVNYTQALMLVVARYPDIAKAINARQVSYAFIKES